MKTSSTIRFSLRAAAAAIALAVGILAISQVFAQTGGIGVGSATINPGASDSVDLQALGVTSPGLGAWEIGIVYDPAVVTAVSCSSAAGSVCNEDFSSSRVQVTGASAGGLLGDTTLASITFLCNTEGTSTLAISVDVFADATTGGPLAFTPSVQNGLITCEEATGLPDRPRPGPTATPAVAPVTGLPSTGGGTGSGGTLNWFVAALSGFGLVALIGFGALRLHARRTSI